MIGLRIERLYRGHPIESFDCGEAALNRFLRHHDLASQQGQSIGAGLLKDAIQRTLAAAIIAGIRAMAVHAKDDRSKSFYAHFGFIPSPTDPLHLYVLLKDVRAVVR